MGHNLHSPSLAFNGSRWHCIALHDVRRVVTCDANIRPCGREGKKTLLDQDLSGTEALVGWGIQVPFQLSCTIKASTNVAYACNIHAA